MPIQQNSIPYVWSSSACSDYQSGALVLDNSSEGLLIEDEYAYACDDGGP